jgi:hypothetical protein
MMKLTRFERSSSIVTFVAYETGTLKHTVAFAKNVLIPGLSKLRLSRHNSCRHLDHQDWSGEDCMAKRNLVTGLFKGRIAAEAAVDALIKRGYTRDDISVLMSDATRTKEFGLQARTHAADGLGIGGAVGGAVGAVVAALAAVGTTLFLPGINLVIAGPIAAALAGAGAGGATGGVIGALIGAGIPEYRAKVYDAELRGGGILIGVEARSDEEVDRLEEMLDELGAAHVRAE